MTRGRLTERRAARARATIGNFGALRASESFAQKTIGLDRSRTRSWWTQISFALSKTTFLSNFHFCICAHADRVHSNDDYDDDERPQKPNWTGRARTIPFDFGRRKSKPNLMSAIPMGRRAASSTSAWATLGHASPVHVCGGGHRRCNGVDGRPRTDSIKRTCTKRTNATTTTATHAPRTLSCAQNRTQSCDSLCCRARASVYDRPLVGGRKARGARTLLLVQGHKCRPLRARRATIVGLVSERASESLI